MLTLYRHQYLANARAVQQILSCSFAEQKAKGTNTFGTSWYAKAKEHWERIQQNYNGMLGGFGSLNDKDIDQSRKFLDKIKLKTNMKLEEALECGAGIGRITKQLLCNVFQTVDIVDQCSNFISVAKEQLAGKNVRNFYRHGLQEFEFKHKYDCIWIQWVLSQLTHEDAIDFLKKSKANLKDQGVIIVKENISGSTQTIIDKNENSLVRPHELYEQIFREAGLSVIETQDNQWPEELYGTKTYALC